MRIFLKNNTIYKIKCLADNKTQGLNVTEALQKIIRYYQILESNT